MLAFIEKLFARVSMIFQVFLHHFLLATSKLSMFIKIFYLWRELLEFGISIFSHFFCNIAAKSLLDW